VSSTREMRDLEDVLTEALEENKPTPTREAA
jgi:hypothetical protein